MKGSSKRQTRDGKGGNRSGGGHSKGKVQFYQYLKT